MPDSRNGDDSLNGAESRKSGDEQDYPCIKCYSTIDAPMDKGIYTSGHHSGFVASSNQINFHMIQSLLFPFK